MAFMGFHHITGSSKQARLDQTRALDINTNITALYHWPRGCWSEKSYLANWSQQLLEN